MKYVKNYSYFDICHFPVKTRQSLFTRSSLYLSSISRKNAPRFLENLTLHRHAKYVKVCLPCYLLILSMSSIIITEKVSFDYYHYFSTFLPFYKYNLKIGQNLFISIILLLCVARKK